MIPEEDIKALLDQVDIVDLIGQYVALEKRGKTFYGPCPFHKDKGNTSFTVSPTKKFFHCFGCGAHGSAIGFVVDHLGIKFPDAVAVVAEAAGIPPPEDKHNHKRNSELVAVKRIFSAALQYYRNELKVAPSAIQFLKSKGITGRTAAKFALGFAPPGWQNLEGALGTESYSSAEVLLSELVIKSEKKSRRYDKFRERLIFPITTVRGEVIGFVGRAVQEKVSPLYLHGAKNDGFGAEQRFFGLAVAHKAIKEARAVIVAPGCVGALILHESGFPNTLGYIRTGVFKAEHLEFLFRLTSNITFCFTQSDSGRQDSWRTAAVVAKTISDKTLVKFVMVPNYVPSNSRTAPGEALDLVDIALHLKTAIDFSDFTVQALTSRFDCSTSEGRAAALAELDMLFADNKGAVRFRQVLEERLASSWSSHIEVLDTTEKHDRFLQDAIEAATSNVVIVSPWITRQGVTRFPLSIAIGAATSRGVRVDIFTDVNFNRERSRSQSGDLVADGSLGQLTQAGATVHFVKGVHSKLVVADDTALCIGSFNWLSAARSGKYQHHELSLVHRDKDFVSFERQKRLAELGKEEESYTGT